MFQSVRAIRVHDSGKLGLMLLKGSGLNLKKLCHLGRCARTAGLLLAVGGLAGAQTYDLLLKGGHVIDPFNGIDGIRDVALAGGRVAAVEAELSDERADTVIDASGLYVTPGLVDIHAHFYVFPAPGTVYGETSSVDPDTTCPRTCVTTAVDVGTVGWRAFPDFRRRIIEAAKKTRVLAMLNIVGMGMVNYDVEQNPARRRDRGH